MTTRQLLERRDVAQTRIIQAIKKAEKFGAKIVGLGALTTPATDGGLDIIDEINIKVTKSTNTSSYGNAKSIRKIQSYAD